MIESYFNKYQNAISPSKRNFISNQKKDFPQQIQIDQTSTVQSTLSKENKKSPKSTQNNIGSFNNSNLNIETNVEDVRSLYVNERKKNLEYRYEITALKSKLINLQKIITEKDHELSRLKYESEKDAIYLLNLEKLLTKYKTMNLKNKNKDINNYNIQMIPNNQENLIKMNSSEAIENAQLREEIIKLKEFKKEIFNISRQNSEINQNIFIPLKKIEEFLFNLNQVYKDKLDDVPLQYQDFYQSKFMTLNEIKEHYSKIMNSIIETIKKKDDEYNYLLNIKDEENELLLKEIENLKNDKNELILENQEKTKIINTLKVENEFISMRDQIKFDDIKKERKLKNQTKKELMDKKLVDEKTKEIKRSVNRSIGKIRRNFDMGDPENIELINNINTQIE